MAIDNKYYVYQVRIDGEEMPFYVGKGKEKRAYRHTTKSLLKETSHKTNKIKKALKDGKEILVEFIEVGLLEKDALLLEIYYISAYGRVIDGTGVLTNATIGGDGVSGYYPTEETRRKMSLAKLGKKQLLDHAKNAAAARIGLKRSKEHNQCVSDRQRGEMNPSSVLTTDLVIHGYILMYEGMTDREIGNILGISVTSFNAIRNGTNWSHLYHLVNHKAPKIKARPRPSKLTDSDVIHIYILLHEGVSVTDITRISGVCNATVRSIKSGKTWGHLYHHYTGDSKCH